MMCKMSGMRGNKYDGQDQIGGEDAASLLCSKPPIGRLILSEGELRIKAVLSRPLLAINKQPAQVLLVLNGKCVLEWPGQLYVFLFCVCVCV